MSKSVEKKKPSAEIAVKTGAVALESKSSISRSVEPQVEPKIRIDSDVTRRIRQHARAHLKTEVCGVLIGESSEGTIDIRASIEALNAAQAGTHVTFTQDAWEEIYKVKDELYPDERIVGWYHSHPGFGIFLSEHDLFIQENFFSSPGQVAWVYDPHSDDEGCFGWVAGKVARLTSISTVYLSGDPVEHATKGQNSESSVNNEEEDEEESPSRSSRSTGMPLWVVISRNVLTHLTVLLAGFAIAFFFFPHILAAIPNPLTGTVDVIEYRDLPAYLEKYASLRKALQLQEQAPPASPIPSTAPPAATQPAASSTIPAATPAPPKASTPATTTPPESPGSHK